MELSDLEKQVLVGALAADTHLKHVYVADPLSPAVRVRAGSFEASGPEAFEALSTLEDQGLVERIGASPSAAEYVLTPAGEKTAEDLASTI